MEFLYFIPGEQAISEAVLRKYNLTGRFDIPAKVRGCRPAEREGNLCAPGTPGSTVVEGVLISLCNEDHLLFDASKQIWERIEEPGKPVWHLGWYRDEPPNQSDLARPDPAGPYILKLGNGEMWTIPAARRVDGGSELPALLKMRPDGSEIEQLMPSSQMLFDKLENLAVEWYDILLQKDGPPKKASDISLALCIEVLAVNYRLGWPEVNALGLITKANRTQIALCAIDIPAFLQTQGKIETMSESQIKKGA